MKAAESSSKSRKSIPPARTRLRAEHVYPVDEWRMVEKRFYPRFLAQAETIFALSNGYLGMRGDFEEGAPVAQPGTFLNGFYESWPIVYGEEAYGFAKTGQTIVNVPDGKIIKLFVDDEPFELASANLIEFTRIQDMRTGTLDRQILWETPYGKRISIKSRRLVSFQHRHLALLDYELTVENAEAYVILSSEVLSRREGRGNDGDPRRTSGFDARSLRAVTSRAEKDRVVLSFRTRQSGLHLACAMDHVVSTECAYSSKAESSEESTRTVFTVEAEPGRPFRLSKFVAYHHSATASPDELCTRAERTLDRSLSLGPDRIIEEQRETLDQFWERSDVRIEGDPATQQGIRFNLYELYQASARLEGYGLPAKGLTGQGYEGHYFWDTEVYVMPFLIYTSPHIARSLLNFRYRMLDQARARASELGHPGALFPWRTISGEEASAYYAAGTAQYHINADIVYALHKYYRSSGDLEVLFHGGAEIMVETARFWTDLGFYSERAGGRFVINGVTGPDEYTAVVNNNRFTNMMARENLRVAVGIMEYLKARYPEDFEHLVDQTGLDLAELDQWRQAADHMCLPVDEKTGIHPQDDSFLEKQPWDFANTPADRYPLLLHYHPLAIYRRQVIKQADVVMALFLLGQDFSLEEKKRNFDYYDPLTTHDSSLSGCIQSIMASEVGYPEKAYELFMEAVLMDLADIGGNVIDGVHVASMGGTWMAVVYGFGGMRDSAGQALSFRPRLPDPWERLSFPLTIRGQRLVVELNREGTTYTLKEGAGLVLRHEETEFRISTEEPVRFPSQPST